MRSLEDLLQSTSNVLFPAELGKRKVAVNDCDCDGDTPLHVIARRKDLGAVEQLIAAGARVNAVGDMGETPLHVAVSVESPEIVRALLSAGANPNVACEFGDTARERALARGGPVARAFKPGGA